MSWINSTLLTGEKKKKMKLTKSLKKVTIDLLLEVLQ